MESHLKKMKENLQNTAGGNCTITTHHKHINALYSKAFSNIKLHN